MGSSLSSLLAREGHDVTVIDNKAEALKKTQYTQDIMCIEGNGATVDTQRKLEQTRRVLLLHVLHMMSLIFYAVW